MGIKEGHKEGRKERHEGLKAGITTKTRLLRGGLAQ